MSQDDIYQVSGHYETSGGAASFRVYYQEEAVRSGIGTDTQILAQSFDDKLTALIRGVLSVSFNFVSIVCHKVSGDREAKFRVDVPTQVGLRAGISLPTNNAILIGLSQGLFSARHNGRIFLPGVSEDDTLIGNLTSAFQVGPLQALVDELVLQLAEESAGTGRWNLGVINGLILNSSPPIKDWQSAFSQVVSVSGSPIIAGQKRRGTQVIGAA